MRRDRRFAFWLLFVCLSGTGIGQVMLFAILPPAAREIGLSPFQVSIIFSVSATIWLFVSPIWGRRSDVVGRRPIIVVGLLGFALSMICLATTIGAALAGWLAVTVAYPLMIVSRSIFALLGSGTGPASQAYVADRTSREERTAGMALMNAALGAGQVVGPAVGAALAIFGLLAPIYFSAGLAVVSAAVIWFLLPEPDVPATRDTTRSTRLSFRDRRITPFIVLAIFMQAARATTVITFAFFLQDMLALSPTETGQYAGVGFMVLGLASVTAQLVVVQRLRPTASTMIHVGLVASLVSFVLFNLEGGFGLYLGALGLLGAGLGLLRPGNAAGASLAVTSEEQGAVAGLIGAIGVVGNIFGPLLGTALYELSPHGPYLLNGALMAAGLVFSFAHPRLRRVRP